MRPQDRSEDHWRFIVEGGTVGFILASCFMTAAVVLLVLLVPRSMELRTPEVLVAPGVVLLVALALAVAAALNGVPVIAQANFLVEHSGLL